jgi:hypothetical protein
VNHFADTMLYEATDADPGECFWYDPALVSGPCIGLSPRWIITVDEEGIAWTWCVDWTG